MRFFKKNANEDKPLTTAEKLAVLDLKDSDPLYLQKLHLCEDLCETSAETCGNYAETCGDMRDLCGNYAGTCANLCGDLREPLRRPLRRHARPLWKLCGDLREPLRKLCENFAELRGDLADLCGDLCVT